MNPFRYFRKESVAKASSSPSKRAPKSRLRVEQLEPREVPANDIFTVTGTGQSVAVDFEWVSRSSQFWNEIGVYEVGDDRGEVAGILPGEAGYAKAALEAAQTVFLAGEFEGAKNTLNFAAGTRLAFYLIQHNTLEAVLEDNPNNRNIQNKQAFFSIDIANRDRIDHVFGVANAGDRSLRLSWEDEFGGGDRDFNDAIINVSHSNQGASQVSGAVGQQIPARFVYHSSTANIKHEFGFFRVDDATGTIGTLTPGSAGYIEAALANSQRTTVFALGSRPGNVKDVKLPGGGFIGLYLIQNASATDFLRVNPENRIGKGPLALFSFDDANPDGASHIEWSAGNKFAFEDSMRGDGDFDDFVGSFTMGKPGNSAPTVKAVIANVNVVHSAANQVIDLAGNFDDADLTNSRIRINTNFGPIEMELFDRAAPRTVANFFTYIQSQRYKSVIFHRSADTNGENFVLQGGGFKFVGGAMATLPEITNSNTPMVVDEPDATNRSNVRGTVAMARSGRNTATSQFFFNLADNSTNLDAQDGGFTVYGRVVDAASMRRIEAVANRATQNHGGAFTEMPLKNYTATPPPATDPFPGNTQRSNYFIINSVQVLSRPEVLRYTVTSSNPAVVTGRINAHRLTLDFLSTGSSRITVRATDKHGKSVVTRFTVTTTNTAPVANTDNVTVTEDVPTTFDPRTNDTDANNDLLTVTSFTQGTSGTVTSGANNTLNYAPNLNFTGTDTFTYTISDGNGGTATGTVRITVNAANDNPVANNDDDIVTDEDLAVTFDPRTNDTDIENNPLTISTFTQGNHGTVTQNVNGTLTYTPAANFHGADSFSYTISDGAGGTATANVTVTVGPLNDNPTAVNDVFETDEGMPVTFNVRENDTDIDGDTLVVDSFTQGGFGTVTSNPDGTLTYTPQAVFHGLDHFTYTVSDGNGGTATTGVIVVVNAIPGVTPNSDPFEGTAIADITTAATAATRDIDLAGVFDDVDLANSLVRLNTNFGAIDLELFDRDAPRTVANFYNYVLANLYNDVIFHREIDNFVLQGGGFKFNDNGANPTTLDAIATGMTPVAREPDAVNRPNVRGTIAMARSSADDATSQFFFNLNDNVSLDSTNSASSVTQGVPFAVFGRVVDNFNMGLVDNAAAVPTQSHASPFTDIPLQNYVDNSTLPDTFPGDSVRENFLIINSVTVLSRPEFLTYSVVSNTNESVVSATLVHNHLKLDFLTAGMATITIAATDSVGNTVQSVFTVTTT